MSNTNKNFVYKVKNFFKEKGHEVQTSHIYDIFSKLLGYENWHIASSKNVNFEEFFNKEKDQELKNVIQWLATGETGLSSKFMALIFIGEKPKEIHYPRDPSDFKRCYLLLEKVPSLRKKMNLLKDVSPIWKKYVENWDALETLYLSEISSGKGPNLYKKMQQIQEVGIS